ncbi:unnamed protein product [Symbiodinium natans]|uniref:Uncharacterized protein n=1 Tax=Symbiodinium natans TaxID=878477 RepID=A0A812VB26_9DINO|nr:unnamed protein product [Symbiodinium natans]
MVGITMNQHTTPSPLPTSNQDVRDEARKAQLDVEDRRRAAFASIKQRTQITSSLTRIPEASALLHPPDHTMQNRKLMEHIRELESEIDTLQGQLEEARLGPKKSPENEESPLRRKKSRAKRSEGEPELVDLEAEEEGGKEAHPSDNDKDNDDDEQSEADRAWQECLANHLQDFQ